MPERLLYRVSEREGEPEAAEQGKTETEEGPPVNVSSEPSYLALAGEPLEDAPVEGERLTAEPGGWSGARPIIFRYQWQRCNAYGEACANISAAVHPGYQLAAKDVGATVRAIVTATGAEAPVAEAPTAPSPVVVAAVEGESIRGSTTSVRLAPATHAFAIRQTVRKQRLGKELRETFAPLQPVPYEVKFTASGKERVMVLTPLGEGAGF